MITKPDRTTTYEEVIQLLESFKIGTSGVTAPKRNYKKYHGITKGIIRKRAKTFAMTLYLEGILLIGKPEKDIIKILEKEIMKEYTDLLNEYA